MKERPILFSGPMVRAILEGRKTMTRRVVKTQPHDGVDSVEWQDCIITGCNTPDQSGFAMMRDGVIESEAIRCPYGAPGDRLWVRETFTLMDPRMSPSEMQGGVLFRASWMYLNTEPIWRPSIHMPRWASRITLEITGVRAERLRDITEEDALAEGVKHEDGVCVLTDKHYIFRCVTAKEVFEQLWAKINGQASWDANPWVWVVEFRRL